MSAKRNCPKRVKRSTVSRQANLDDVNNDDSSFEQDDPEDRDEARKSRIRDSNKEFARRMTILQAWSDHWTDYTTREGPAYPLHEARAMIKRTKKIVCPITSCGKTFTTIGGLKYHYARCNIERAFKCKLCNPTLQVTTRGELLRHMILSHYDDLPRLNADQEGIVNTYLSCETRGDKTKKERKISADTEPPCNAQRLVRAFTDLQSRVYLSEAFSGRPFKDWQTGGRNWESVTSEFDRRRYYPPEFESVRFKATNSDKWSTVRVGGSAVLNRNKKNSPTSLVFFTGGITTATAWLPKSPTDMRASSTPDLIAVSVNCSSMDHNLTYGDSHEGEACIQFWSFSNDTLEDGQIESKVNLSYILGHQYGVIFDMAWCPLGTSWQPQVNTGDALARVGLLALACGDGQIRILSIPHAQTLLSRSGNRMSGSTIDSTPIFKIKPVATLMGPGVGPSTGYQKLACKTISWNMEFNQRLIVAGYSNGHVALFDLANNSPILRANIDGCHVYQPLKSWVAHGAPVTGVAITSTALDRTLIATGSADRQLKIWNPLDPLSCLCTDRAPITKVLWDFRSRGVVTATDTAFTSYNNRVSYRYPVVEGSQNVTVSIHRSTVWGLANSLITNAIATSDGAGELFVMPQLLHRSPNKRDRSLLSTHSLFNILPRPAGDAEMGTISAPIINHDDETQGTNSRTISSDKGDIDENGDPELEANFSSVERQVANKPTKFLLPIEHRAVETYLDFKANFGLEFVHHNCTATNPEAKLPESCIRASDIKNIYCDRPCDYPFASISNVSWSPNAKTFPYLLSATQVGLCCLDRVQIVEQIYRGHVDSIIPTTDEN